MIPHKPRRGCAPRKGGGWEAQRGCGSKAARGGKPPNHKKKKQWPEQKSKDTLTRGQTFKDRVIFYQSGRTKKETNDTNLNPCREIASKLCKKRLPLTPHAEKGVGSHNSIGKPGVQKDLRKDDPG